MIRSLTLLFALATISCKGQESTKFETMKVAIFLYDGVELLDFSGPGEVFQSTMVERDGERRAPFEVFTVAVSKEILTSQKFLEIKPDYSIEDCPQPDILVLPGGSTGASLRNPKVIEWIRKLAPELEVAMSVCTGAFLLGEAGLLDGLQVTTYHTYIGDLQQKYPSAQVLGDKRFIDNGNVLTTAGVSAGIDGALQVVSRLYGLETALNTARYMEYDKWTPEEGLVVSPGH